MAMSNTDEVFWRVFPCPEASEPSVFQTEDKITVFFIWKGKQVAVTATKKYLDELEGLVVE